MLNVEERFQIWIMCIGLVGSLPLRSIAVEAWTSDFQIKPLERIPAKTIIDMKATQGWSDLLIFVSATLGEGDTDAVNSTVKHYAGLFNLVYMANVGKDSNGASYLDKVGVGFSTNIDGQNVVITSKTHKQQKAGLSMIGGMVFSANERALDGIVQVARYRDGVLFDAPTIMLRNGVHEKMIVRFFVWVSPEGKVGTVCWLLDGFGTDQYRRPDSELVLLKPHLHEKRDMHVDGDEFTFGVPSESAFALMSLPPGRKYQVSDAFNETLAQTKFNDESFKAFLQGLAKTLAK